MHLALLHQFLYLKSEESFEWSIRTSFAMWGLDGRKLILFILQEIKSCNAIVSSDNPNP